MSDKKEWALFSSYSTDHDAMKWAVTRDSEISLEVETPRRVKVVEASALEELQAELDQEKYYHREYYEKGARYLEERLKLQAELTRARELIREMVNELDRYGSVSTEASAVLAKAKAFGEKP